MKIVRFRLKPEAETFYGVLDGPSIKRLSAEPYDGLHFTGDEYAADSVIFDAPCEPSKIVAVGKNYRAHADEMGEGFPPEPLLFLKPSTSVIACGEAVIYPEISHRLDYEGELAVVIGIDGVAGYAAVDAVAPHDHLRQVVAVGQAAGIGDLVGRVAVAVGVLEAARPDLIEHHVLIPAVTSHIVLPLSVFSLL